MCTWYMYSVHVHTCLYMYNNVRIRLVLSFYYSVLCTVYCTRTCTYIDLIHVMSQLKYVRLFPDNAAILSGKKIAHFYTISETQAARNFYFQYVNY